MESVTAYQDCAGDDGEKSYFHCRIEKGISKIAMFPTENGPLCQRFLNSWKDKSFYEFIILEKNYFCQKVSPSTTCKFQIQTSVLWFTCGASIEKLVGDEPLFDSLFIRNNVACQMVASIYYGAKYAIWCSYLMFILSFFVNFIVKFCR